MSRLAAVVLAVLVVATVGAFFVTQHLKVSNPLINGQPRPDPPAINPVSGRVCRDLAGQRVSFKRTRIGFYLQSRADTVLVYVVDTEGNIVASAGGSGRYLRPGPRYTYFTWDGRESDGQVAPDGTYFFRVALQAENRTFTLPTGVQVITAPPHPIVSRVVPTGGALSAGPAIIDPPARTVTIHFVRGAYRQTHIEILRSGGPGRLPVVKTFGVNGRRGKAVWDGLIDGHPAPAGTYLVGMDVTDRACDEGRFPAANPPSPGSTAHAGVTVRYLAAAPPLVPSPAGGEATVYVDSRRRPYLWALRRPGEAMVLERGTIGRAAAAAGRGVALHLRLPAQGAGLYRLSLRSGPHRSVVPLVAEAAARRAAARVLVVLPALTWQGLNPVDDSGDGLPDTLSAGDRIDLGRPLVNGLPADFGEVSVLLGWLDRHHFPFQLTTDLALASGVGPQLAGHTGVVLDGSFRWLPSGLGERLRSFATAGGRVLTLGLRSLEATAPVTRSGAGLLEAGPPTPVSAGIDIFGVRHLAPIAGNREILTVVSDPLNLFGGTSGALAGFSSLQPLQVKPGIRASLAGIADTTTSVAGFRLGRGFVVEVALGGFAWRLAGDADAAALLRRSWQILSG